jgi:iron complex outermembrane receptor protein
MAAWKDVNARNILEAKVAYFNEFTRYSDPRFDVYSVIATQTALAQLESSWTLFKITRLFAGTSLTYNNGDLSAYDGTRQECNWALFASLMQPAPSIGWEFVLHMRQEFQSSFTSPFTFGISAQGPVAGPMSMQFSFSRNFRSPTMNERYWQPGGNPGLNPELSWNGDLSIVFNQPTETARFEARMTIFSSLVDNWIMWVPGEILWTVENVLKVWARGIEVTARQETYVSGFQLVFDESYSYTRSTNEKQLDGNDDSYKKQLIYVPVHQAMLRTFLGWKGFGLAIKNTISGKTYTTRDNESSLPAYLLMDVAISKKFKVAGKCTMDLSLVGNNLLNKEYQVTPFRPMPGINFLVSLNVELNHQNKQSK